MRRRRIQFYIFVALAIMTFLFQAVNFWHLFLALVPYQGAMAAPAALSFTFIPAAVVLANTFRSNTRDRRIMRALFAVAAISFIGEALANLAVGAYEADGKQVMIVQIAHLFGVTYRQALFTGAVAYAMAPSIMVAGLVWSLTNAANEVLGPPVPNITSLPQVPMAAQDAVHAEGAG